ncbi:MAG: site-2 protease family protein [Candidatus Hydrogenedentes bacterium]|nr:site-2 protease family protein [Candidatus Hydrogenedentota bacterium]
MLLFDIAIFLVVLGVLVFFHEMGHFLAAKACGIYCDRFSLGMPPRVWGFRWGDTDYCIGALPIGGYVKMAGQEDAPKSVEEREKEYGHVPPDRWFNNKPVWQRIIVIVAGPLMNLVLGCLLYGLVATVGAEVPEGEVDNRIGEVLPDSPAAMAPLYRVLPGQYEVDYASVPPDAVGWQTGDRILSINRDRVRSVVYDVRFDAMLGAGKVLEVEIERVASDGSVTRYLSPVQPKELGGEPYAKFGVGPFQTALVDDVIEDTPARAAGLRSGDVIVRANGNWVDAPTLSQMVEKLNADERLEIEVVRAGQTLKFELQPKRVGRFREVIFQPTLATRDDKELAAQPVVASITDKLKEATGLQRKDVILEVNGRPATVAELRAAEQQRVGEKVTLKIRRPAILFGLLQRADVKTVHLEATPVGQIGVQWGLKKVFHQVPLQDAAPEAFQSGYNALELTVKSLAMLVTGTVKPKELGGPLMIYSATTGAAKMGLSYLMKLTAFISVNLCVFNLLPLPVLDGGLLVLLIIEGIRRKPMDVRILERIQQIGLVFIIGLILFVTYNDLFRMVSNVLP